MGAGPDVVAQPCNLSTWKVVAGLSEHCPAVWQFKTNRSYTRDPVSKWEAKKKPSRTNMHCQHEAVYHQSVNQNRTLKRVKQYWGEVGSTYVAYFLFHRCHIFYIAIKPFICISAESHFKHGHIIDKVGPMACFLLIVNCVLIIMQRGWGNNCTTRTLNPEWHLQVCNSSVLEVGARGSRTQCLL